MSRTHREVCVELRNLSSNYILHEPRHHLICGRCQDPLPPTIQPKETGKALFKKVPDTACGSVSVFTYSIMDKSSKQDLGKLAVMFSNPYDFNLYSNWYAVGELKMQKLCDYNLYYEMYYCNEIDFVRGKANGRSLSHEGRYVTVKATMSDSWQPVLKVDVNNK
ncbi:DELTA-actitoxin-Aeq1c [Kryptolebias marmoratus]|nr:DELTA-actitoxin-Aeq1c [Kryptolebias marmoratus]